nr:MAG TPA: hypothetical protein [Caudoviricetes sp.]
MKIIKKLLILLGKKEKQPIRTPNNFDYTKQSWGHALQFVVGFKQKGKFPITGHFFGRGIYGCSCPEEGDTLTIAFKGGKTGLLKIHKISFFRNPNDMFEATVSFEGLINA